MEKRPLKKSDQKEIEKAFNLLTDCMKNHPEIEPTLWADAVWSVLVEGYKRCGMSYDEFSKEWDRVKNHYKPWFYKQ